MEEITTELMTLFQLSSFRHLEFPYAIRQTDIDWSVVSLVTGKRVMTIARKQADAVIVQGEWLPEQDGFCSVQ